MIQFIFGGKFAGKISSIVVRTLDSGYCASEDHIKFNISYSMSSDGSEEWNSIVISKAVNEMHWFFHTKDYLPRQFLPVSINSILNNLISFCPYPLSLTQVIPPPKFPQFPSSRNFRQPSFTTLRCSNAFWKTRI